MIAVCIATYNQEAFIAQAIESARMQVCDEPIRIYIGDDASTDDTQAVCARIAAQDARIAYTRREQNMGLVGNTIELYRSILADGCEYIAMLDGDDYWTNPRKLQKELDYLRTHPDTGFVHTAVEGQGDEPIPTGDLRDRYNLAGARHTNCTVLFRADLLRPNELDDIERQGFPVLDYPLYGLFAQRTRFAYLADPTAVWRDHSSVSQPSSRRARWHYRRERLRMWHWLDKKCPGHFHFRYDKAILWYIWHFFTFYLHK